MPVADHVVYDCPCGATLTGREAFSIHLQLAHTQDERVKIWTDTFGPNKVYRGSRDEAHAERLQDARARG